MSTLAASRAPLFGPQALGGVFVLLWSTAWIAGKVGLEFTGPLTLLVIRFAAAALVMLPIALLTGAPWPR
jgi:drug/metabolite transporter (DMT)-like permease